MTMTTRENKTGRGTGASARAAVGVAAGVAVVVGLLAAVWAACSSEHWLGSALMGRAFVTAAAVFVGGLALSVALAAGLWRAGRPYRRARRGRGALAALWNDRGAAIVEFALVLPFLLMLGLLMAQSALLMTGIVVVHYSAHCAARTAVVVVPLAPRNVLPEDGVKHARIRDAALWAVTPISCGSRLYPVADCDTVRRGVMAHWVSHNRSRPGWLDLYGSLPHRARYAADHTTVTVRPPAVGAMYGAHEDLVVDVSHVFYLGVPYAGRLLSSLFGDDGRTLSAPSGGYGVVLHATSRLPNQGAQDFVDIERFQDWQGS